MYSYIHFALAPRRRILICYALSYAIGNKHLLEQKPSNLSRALTAIIRILVCWNSVVFRLFVWVCSCFCFPLFSSDCVLFRCACVSLGLMYLFHLKLLWQCQLIALAESMSKSLMDLFDVFLYKGGTISQRSNSFHVHLPLCKCVTLDSVAWSYTYQQCSG